MLSRLDWPKYRLGYDTLKGKRQMDDLTKILLISSLTALGTVVVFVASQILGKLVIEPVQEVKRLLGEIRHALVFHAPAILTPVGDRAGEDKAAEVLRKLSCDLHSKISSVPFYDQWAWVSKGFLPRQSDAREVAKDLLGLSNSVYSSPRPDSNGARIAKIERLLRFESMDE